jgi:hypothetical protein
MLPNRLCVARIVMLFHQLFEQTFLGRSAHLPDSVSMDADLEQWVEFRVKGKTRDPKLSENNIFCV